MVGLVVLLTAGKQINKSRKRDLDGLNAVYIKNTILSSLQFGSSIPEKSKIGLWYETGHELTILILILTINFVNPFTKKK